MPTLKFSNETFWVIFKHCDGPGFWIWRWDKRTLHDYYRTEYPTSIIFAWHRIVYVTLVNFFLVAVAVNFACLGRDVWCSIALYCSFFFTIAVTMRSNWGGSNNPFPFHLLSIIVVIIIISLQVDDYYNKTAAGKKGYRAFSLSLCNHNNHLPWYCRAEPKPPTLKHASRKTMSVSEAQWSFFLQFVTSSCNHTDFERSERFQVPFTLKKYEWFHQYRCPK